MKKTDRFFFLIRFLEWVQNICYGGCVGVTRLDNIRNESLFGSLGIVGVVGKLRGMARERKMME